MGRELARRLRGVRQSDSDRALGLGIVAALFSSAVIAGLWGAYVLAVPAAASAVCAAFAVIFGARSHDRVGRLVILRRRYREFAEVYSVRRLVLFAIGVSVAVLAAAFALLG